MIINLHFFWFHATFFITDIVIIIFRMTVSTGRVFLHVVRHNIMMADILIFKKKTPAEKHKGKTLCRSGFHKWEILTDRKFDVKQGKLVTVFKCKRCGKQKNAAI